MSDTEQIVGTLLGVMEKPSGWTQVQINVEGLQYPVKADTKKQEIIDAAKAVGTEVATWTIKVTESENINPHSGNPYKNRYLEAVELGEHVTMAPASGSTEERKAVEPHHQPLHFADKDRVITRLACLRTAAMIASEDDNIPEDDMSLKVIDIAGRLEIWVMRDIDEVPFDGQTGLTPHDDNIPF